MQSERIRNSPAQILRTELAKRCRQNPKYSLRALARAMGMSHTLVSLIMNGKRDVTPQTAQKIAQSLGLSPAERKALSTSKTRAEKKSSIEFGLLELDQFELISDWQHFAILSLMEIPRAQFRAKWVAGRLGIGEIEAQAAMDRLVRLNLMANSRGRWRQTGAPLTVENKISTSATRKYNRQLLEKAIASLENDPIEVRDFSSITFAMDPGLVERALKKIREFRRELCQELEETSDPKEVYMLTVQLFPVSRSKSGE